MANVVTKHTPDWAIELGIGVIWAASAVEVAGYTWTSITQTWSALPDGSNNQSTTTNLLNQAVASAPTSGKLLNKLGIGANNPFYRFTRGVANFFQAKTGLPIASSSVQSGTGKIPKSFYDTVAYTKAGNVAAANKSYLATIQALQQMPLGGFSGQENFVFAYLVTKLYGKPMMNKFTQLTGKSADTVVTPVNAPR